MDRVVKNVMKETEEVAKGERECTVNSFLDNVRTHTHTQIHNMSESGLGLVCMIRFHYHNSRLGSSGIHSVH